MLSYQHIYHAGNLADVHKHALLSCVLSYLTRKDKPLSYIETHAGRGLYNLTDAEAQKTGEAQAGVLRLLSRFDTDHPYPKAVESVREKHGPYAYPGSPMIATEMLRPGDAIHLAELHPAEAQALAHNMTGSTAKVHKQNGFDLAHAMTPPQPRRGVMLIDPSYEVKTDYNDIPRHITKLAKAWNVGIIMVWYPLLFDHRQKPMVAALRAADDTALCHEIRFPPAREGHGMVGSGMFVIRPTFGLEAEIKRLDAVFSALGKRED